MQNVGDKDDPIKDQEHKDQFEKSCSNDCEETTDYDYFSIMHYSSYAFSKNKKQTMRARIPTSDPNSTGITYTLPGDRYRLTENDIKKINDKYEAPE